MANPPPTPAAKPIAMWGTRIQPNALQPGTITPDYGNGLRRPRPQSCALLLIAKLAQSNFLARSIIFDYYSRNGFYYLFVKVMSGCAHGKPLGIMGCCVKLSMPVKRLNA